MVVTDLVVEEDADGGVLRPTDGHHLIRGEEVALTRNDHLQRSGRVLALRLMVGARAPRCGTEARALLDLGLLGSLHEAIVTNGDWIPLKKRQATDEGAGGPSANSNCRAKNQVTAVWDGGRRWPFSRSIEMLGPHMLAG
jgi:hypothetical protein